MAPVHVHDSAMTPSTPKSTSKAMDVDYHDGDEDEDELVTPSPDQVNFPEDTTVAIPFRLRPGGASTELENASDIHYQDDETKTATDLTVNPGPNRNLKATGEISGGTQDFLLTRRIFKSEETVSITPLRLIKSFGPKHQSSASSSASRLATLPERAEDELEIARVVDDQPRQKKVRVEVPLELRRWSKRIAGPATEFNRYFRRLPLELQKSIWEYASAVTYKGSRCVYIRNRALRPSNGVFEDGVLNKMPALWDTCGASRDTMLIDYELMFARIVGPGPAATDDDEEKRPALRPDQRLGPSVAHLPKKPFTNNHTDYEHEYDLTNQQLVNPDSDVIILEPCCTGCRAYHCVKRQFNFKDRSSVRYLALHTEPVNLPATTRHCWMTIASSFVLVEKLYLIVNFDDMPRNSSKRRALIRVKEGGQEQYLRRAFAMWKTVALINNGGRDSHIKEIIFVAMVEMQRPRPGQKPGEQYDFVKNRMGGPHDIIVG